MFFEGGNVKKLRKIWKILICVCLLLTGSFLIYTADYYHADANADKYLVSDAEVTVTQENDAVIFEPEKPLAGIVFYPGAKVEYTSSAKLCHELAENGIRCCLAKMPFNLAFFGIDRAEKLMQNDVKDWYMAGHSLGGSMAAVFASKHADSLDGLILLASYSTEDLSHSGLKVLSVYGEKDGVLNRENYRKNRNNLPEKTEEKIIEVGNHAGFGQYGKQKKDGTSSNALQIEETVSAVVSFVKN